MMEVPAELSLPIARCMLTGVCSSLHAGTELPVLDGWYLTHDVPVKRASDVPH